MSDQITVKAQMIKAATRPDGALRVTLDVFGADQIQVMLMTQLAMEQTVISFTPKEVKDV